MYLNTSFRPKVLLEPTRPSRGEDEQRVLLTSYDVILYSSFTDFVESDTGTKTVLPYRTLRHKSLGHILTLILRKSQGVDVALHVVMVYSEGEMTPRKDSEPPRRVVLRVRRQTGTTERHSLFKRTVLNYTVTNQSNLIWILTFTISI